MRGDQGFVWVFGDAGLNVPIQSSQIVIEFVKIALKERFMLRPLVRQRLPDGIGLPGGQFQIEPCGEGMVFMGMIALGAVAVGHCLGATAPARFAARKMAGLGIWPGLYP